MLHSRYGTIEVMLWFLFAVVWAGNGVRLLSEGHCAEEASNMENFCLHHIHEKWTSYPGLSDIKQVFISHNSMSDSYCDIFVSTTIGGCLYSSGITNATGRITQDKYFSEVYWLEFSQKYSSKNRNCSKWPIVVNSYPDDPRDICSVDYGINFWMFTDCATMESLNTQSENRNRYFNDTAPNGYTLLLSWDLISVVPVAPYYSFYSSVNTRWVVIKSDVYDYLMYKGY